MFGRQTFRVKIVSCSPTCHSGLRTCSKETFLSVKCFLDTHCVGRKLRSEVVVERRGETHTLCPQFSSRQLPQCVGQKRPFPFAGTHFKNQRKCSVLKYNYFIYTIFALSFPFTCHCTGPPCERRGPGIMWLPPGPNLPWEGGPARRGCVPCLLPATPPFRTPPFKGRPQTQRRRAVWFEITFARATLSHYERISALAGASRQ